jgi:uncharacterized protein (DUF58 family)
MIWRLRPTARGLGVAAGGATLVVLGMLSGTRDPYALAALAWLPVLVAPVIVLGRARRCRGLAVRLRAVPPLAAAGDVIRLEVTATKRAGTASPPVGIDRRAPASRVVAPAPTALRRVPPLVPGQSHASAVLRRMARRGRFDVGSGQVWVHDHFALCAAPVSSVPAVTVVVYPAPVPVATPWRQGFDQRGAPDDHALAAGARQDGELLGLRPYVPGDRLHLVHWPSMSRSEGIYVKDIGSEATRARRIVVDDRAGAHRRGPFEEMLGVAVALLNEAGRTGSAVELSTMSGRHCTVAPDSAGLARAMSFLAVTRPHRGVAVSRPASGETSTVVTTATGAATLPATLRASAVLVVAS